MKKMLAILCVTALTTGAFSQGLVDFNNSPSTLVMFWPGWGNMQTIEGAAGSWYFALLTSPSGLAGTFTFSGNYATNSGVATGRFIGGTQPVNGWAPGTTRFYEVAGWSQSLGPTWQQSWLVGNYQGGLFGLSSYASGVAGGGTPPVPPFPLFGGTGINSGFTLVPNGLIPEPSSMALMGFGVAVFLFSIANPGRTSTCSLTPR
jgi:hypothetical protein